MILHVKEAKYLHDYVIWVKFNDGIAGEVDLGLELTGEIFGPLKDKKVFRAFKIDPILETIVWENGADLAPEFLRIILKFQHEVFMMKDRIQDNPIGLLGRAFFVGIVLDCFWLAIVYATWGFKEGAFFIVSIVSVAHLVSSVGLAIYRNEDLTKSDLNYIRFGLLFALWQLFSICC